MMEKLSSTILKRHSISLLQSLFRHLSHHIFSLEERSGLCGRRERYIQIITTVRNGPLPFSNPRLQKEQAFGIAALSFWVILLIWNSASIWGWWGVTFFLALVSSWRGFFFKGLGLVGTWGEWDTCLDVVTYCVERRWFLVGLGVMDSVYLGGRDWCYISGCTWRPGLFVFLFERYWIECMSSNQFFSTSQTWLCDLMILLSSKKMSCELESRISATIETSKSSASHSDASDSNQLQPK